MTEYTDGIANLQMDKDFNLYPSADVLKKQVESGKKHVIMQGDWEGRHFAIVRHSCGFPDAYVEVKEDDWLYQLDCKDGCCKYDAFEGWVHGGATYYGRCYWDDNDNRFYLGWDYGHCGDYESFSGELFPDIDGRHGKKWLISEVLMDIAGAVHDLDWMNRIHENDDKG